MSLLLSQIGAPPVETGKPTMRYWSGTPFMRIGGQVIGSRWWMLVILVREVLSGRH